ncbi:hypothetical protein KDA_42470 [Dictyobacter alpinus]|uniref:Uncharacterized protein n=1 Tax=Dictyobacter alpinus TaxID=2014873 RepID=A0A402BBJ4_9CHLR|nr:hypothetical protein [Dictyobacter alpinus]GCE28763.1 hypothetical protein KDA_42470 [Dictyobacter alpinus]
MTETVLYFLLLVSRISFITSEPGAPLITSIAGNKISWRGSDIAVNYSLENSSSGNNGPWTII